ncbi:hypothetical protein VTO42DRAFT_8083 [Malbranchea cinnamomea]
MYGTGNIPLSAIPLSDMIRLRASGQPQAPGLSNALGDWIMGRLVESGRWPTARFPPAIPFLPQDHTVSSLSLLISLRLGALHGRKDLLEGGTDNSLLCSLECGVASPQKPPTIVLFPWTAGHRLHASPTKTEKPLSLSLTTIQTTRVHLIGICETDSLWLMAR